MSRYKDSRIFGLKELETFLRAIDRHLCERTTMIITGGSAAAFHADSTTNDIDTYGAVSSVLRAAVDEAAVETGLRVPVGLAVLGQYPWFFEDRLERKLPELANLEVYVLERHDLALSKSLRGYDNDEQQLQEMHLSNPFVFETLLERFRTEMTHVTGTESDRHEKFLALVELLFGELKRIAAEKALRGR